GACPAPRGADRGRGTPWRRRRRHAPMPRGGRLQRREEAWPLAVVAAVGVTGIALPGTLAAPAPALAAGARAPACSWGDRGRRQRRRTARVVLRVTGKTPISQGLQELRSFLPSEAEPSSRWRPLMEQLDDRLQLAESRAERAEESFYASTQTMSQAAGRANSDLADLFLFSLALVVGILMMFLVGLVIRLSAPEAPNPEPSPGERARGAVLRALGVPPERQRQDRRTRYGIIGVLQWLFRPSRNLVAARGQLPSEQATLPGESGSLPEGEGDASAASPDAPPSVSAWDVRIRQRARGMSKNRRRGCRGAPGLGRGAGRSARGQLARVPDAGPRDGGAAAAAGLLQVQGGPAGGRHRPARGGHGAATGPLALQGGRAEDAG
ncbi:unnamed protein product, partial [Prorocentrum cordatum]